MIVTRFAPSPTGYLHIGGLRTALYSYLYARKNNGKFLLRIEDTDMARNSEEATKAIIEAFDWVGLEHDGEVLYQSKRFDIYKKYIQQLLDEGKAYYCYTTKEELEELRKEQEAQKIRPRYDGRYRDFKGTPPEGISPVVRIKAPREGKIEFVDLVKGAMSFEADDILDDFIIARADGTPTYNFVVVIDDALMGVTDVIRGDDHLSNTPKQIILYEALGFKTPNFAHLAMINGPDGKKFSKRHGAANVMEYQAMGILPEALLNFLLRLGWSHGDDEIFSIDEMKKLFNLENISKGSSTLNQEKLMWLNAHYIKTLDYKTINEHTKRLGFDFDSFEKPVELMDMLRDRSKTLLDMIDSAKTIINSPINYDEKALSKFLNDESKAALTKYAQELDSVDNIDDYEAYTNEFLEKNSLALKHLAGVLRIALTGVGVSPSIFLMMKVIEFDEIKRRINNFLKVVK